VSSLPVLCIRQNRNLWIVTSFLLILALQLFMQNFGLLNQFLPPSSILDKGLPIWHFWLLYIFYNIILPAYLWSSYWPSWITVTYILTIKANQMHYFSDLFDKVFYMFRTDLLSIIRSLNTVYKQYMLVMLASASRQPTELACIAMYTVLRYSWWWTVDMSETCRALYQINLRNSAFGWLLL